jgi:hypothetical protein
LNTSAKRPSAVQARSERRSRELDERRASRPLTGAAPSPGTDGAGPPARQGDTLAASAIKGDMTGDTRRPNGLDLVLRAADNCDCSKGNPEGGSMIGGLPLTLEVARTRRHSLARRLAPRP